MEALLTLMEKLTQLCMPHVIDQMSRHSYLVIIQDRHDEELRNLPINKHALGSEQMVYRGKRTKEIFTKYSSSITRDAAKYTHTADIRSQQQAATNRQTADMHALLSHKLPPELHRDPYGAFAPTAKVSKPSSLGAVDTHEQSYDIQDRNDSAEEDLAAMAERPESVSRYNDRQWGKGPFKRNRGDDEPVAGRPMARRRFDQGDRSNTSRTREKQVTFSTGVPGNNNTANTGRKGRRAPRPLRGELPHDAPRPNALEEDIKRYIMVNKTCFYHARGEMCPNMTDHSFCPFSHAQAPIPWKAYPRQTKQPSKERELAAIALEQFEYEPTFSSTQDASSSAHDPDDSDEAETLRAESSHHN